MKTNRKLTFPVTVLFVVCSALVAAPSVRAATQETVAADRISVEDFKVLLASNKPIIVLDVRGGGDTKIKGARHIPLGELEKRLGELPRDREIVTYCA